MKRGSKTRSWLIPVIVILVFVIIIFIIIKALNGETTVTGEYEGTKKLETLVCESDTVSYPIFNYDNSDSKHLKINVAFENEKLTSIALIYKLDYANQDAMRQSEAFNHAAMNLSFYDDNMESDDLNAKYSFLGNSLQMTIYARNSELNEKSLRYFMLYNIYEVKNLTKEKMAKIYNNAGLDCEIKHNKTKEEVNEN